jgi:hypothetical protein
MYILIIVAVVGMKASILGRTHIKSHHIISLAFEIRSPTGQHDHLYLTIAAHSYTNSYLEEPTKILITNTIIPAIERIRNIQGLSCALQSQFGLDFQDVDATQLYLDNIPTKLITSSLYLSQKLIWLNSTFNVDSQRLLYEKQSHRSDIWDRIFTLKPPPEQSMSLKDIPIHHYPIHSPPTIREAIIITTPLLFAPSASTPCNAKNRISWTTRERRKASRAEKAEDVPALQKMVISISVISLSLLRLSYFLS